MGGRRTKPTEPPVETRPEVLERYYRDQIEIHLDEFRRYRALRRGERVPEFGDLNPAMLRAAADVADVRDPPDDLSDDESVAWHYWIEVVELTRLQARMMLLGVPIVATRPGDADDLASVNSAVADLIRGMLEGCIIEEFQLAAQRQRQPTAPPRRRDALHKIAAVASLAADGHIPDLTSRKALELAGEKLGLSWEGVRKAAQRAGLNRVLDPMRAMVLRLPPEERSRWAMTEIAESAQEYREWDTSRRELSHQ